MKKTLAAPVALAFWIFALCLPAFAEFRIWEGRNGSIAEAEMAAAFGKKAVLLRKQDGKILTVPISRLSKTDQEYVKKWITTRANSPASKTGENHFYVLRFWFSSWSGWASINILPPWNSKYRVLDTTVVEPEEDRDFFRVSAFHVNKDRAYQHHEVEVVYMVLLPSTCQQDLELVMGKGSRGSTRLVVQGFNTEKDMYKRLRSFSNHTTTGGRNEAYHTIPFRVIRRLGCVEFDPASIR